MQGHGANHVAVFLKPLLMVVRDVCLLQASCKNVESKPFPVLLVPETGLCLPTRFLGFSEFGETGPDLILSLLELLQRHEDSGFSLQKDVVGSGWVVVSE